MSTKSLKTLIKNVEDLLYSRRMTKTELGRELGVSRQALGTFFSGDHQPTLGRIEAIAEVFGVSVLDLLATPEERAKLEATPSLSEKIQGEVSSLDEMELKVVLEMIESVKSTRERRNPKDKKNVG